MVSGRRLGSENSATRDLILKAAVGVLQDEGGSKLTAARIAKKAGVKAHMVHYYFRTMDDLVVALVRTHGRTGLNNAARLIVEGEPLRALWELEVSYKQSAAAVEFSSIARRGTVAREELKRYIEEIRSVQAEGIARHFELRGITSPYPPLALTLIVPAIARQIVRERDLDVTLGHKEAVAAIEKFLGSVTTASKST